MRKGSTSRQRIEEIRCDGAGGVRRRARRDVLATEEPLEVRVAAGSVHPVSVTMRTPGSDFELAAGFLFAEGILERPAEVAAIRYCVDEAGEGAQQYNVVQVVLVPGATFDPTILRRNFYTTSSCGVCGKASIEALRATAPCPWLGGAAAVRAETLLRLPGRLREEQPVFERTGGLHAAALFTLEGELLRVREDVGRHNALDKLIGSAWLAGETPLSERVAMVSGRLSFELVQKAARAGIPILAGVSAPSSLAVDLAREAGMTLVGFLRADRFNVYAGPQRVLGAGAADGSLR
jgi:FdhD protein